MEGLESSVSSSEVPNIVSHNINVSSSSFCPTKASDSANNQSTNVIINIDFNGKYSLFEDYCTDFVINNQHTPAINIFRSVDNAYKLSRCLSALRIKNFLDDMSAYLLYLTGLTDHLVCLCVESDLIMFPQKDKWMKLGDHLKNIRNFWYKLLNLKYLKLSMEQMTSIVNLFKLWKQMLSNCQLNGLFDDVSLLANIIKMKLKVSLETKVEEVEEVPKLTSKPDLKRKIEDKKESNKKIKLQETHDVLAQNLLENSHETSKIKVQEKQKSPIKLIPNNNNDLNEENNMQKLVKKSKPGIKMYFRVYDKSEVNQKDLEAEDRKKREKDEEGRLKNRNALKELGFSNSPVQDNVRIQDDKSLENSITEPAINPSNELKEKQTRTNAFTMMMSQMRAQSRLGASVSRK